MKINILILHGWGKGAQPYGALKHLLEDRGYNVYLFDLPGFGQADPPPAVWNLDDYVEFIVNFLRTENLSKIIIIGHSFGGRIAIKLAYLYPDILDGLILMSAAGIKHSLTLRERIAYCLAKFSKPLFKRLFPQDEKINFFLKVLSRVSGNKDYVAASGVMRKVLKEVIKEDLVQYLSQIQCPTLVLWGREDKITPVSDAYLMHHKIKNSNLVILDGVGHLPYKESPEQVAENISQFIKSLSLDRVNF
jgi:pimeloyl-ACP methyl ester carboxylesterase